MKKKQKSRSKESSPNRQKQAAQSQSCPALREDCFRIMNEDGTVDPKRDPKLNKDLLLRLYRNMVLNRVFDERGMMLQRQGRIGFYVPSFGQEAVQTGTAAALNKEDWVFPSYREPGVFLYRGAGLYEMLCNLWGNAGDLCKGRQMPVHYSFPEIKMFSVSSPIATQVIQAVGAAMAAKISKRSEIAITYCGDGGTSENDFHTGLTFGGAYRAPVVFVVTNNQLAISVPFKKQTAAQKISDKGVGYGVPAIAVDGNDILAVYEATRNAVERARKGEGPSLIECFTFRMGPHSSSDDPTRYRDEKTYQAWAKRDPIQRLKVYLQSKQLWDEKKEKALYEELKAQLAEAVELAEKQPNPDPDSLFDDVFAELTPQLKKQKAELLQEAELRGKFENTSEAFPL